MFPKTIVSILILTFIASCTNDSSIDQDGTIDIEDKDTSLVIDLLDTIDIEADTIADNIVYDDPEVQAAHKEIVKKYGIQWDFCTCIVKNDSVDKALQADHLSDDDFDILFERSEFIDNKCKGLLIQPNATPEDRQKHEKKVNKCLKEHAASK